MLAHHFADRIEGPPLPGQPDANHCARATLAELERAVRDRACTGIRVDVPELGYIPVSKAEVCERLQWLRGRDDPPAFLYVTISRDGLLYFDRLATAIYRAHDLRRETPMIATGGVSR